MVKLGLEKDEDLKVQIRIKGNKRIVDSRFLRALSYSLLIHLVVFGLFRIKTQLVEEEPPPLLAIEVAVVSEKADDHESVNDGQVIAEAVEDSYDKKLIFSENEPLKPEPVLIPEDQVFTKERIIRSLCMKAPDDQSHIVEFDGNTVTFHEPKAILWKDVVYPLTLRVSGSLSSLIMIEDGSSLFKEKMRNNPAPLASSANVPEIEYKIKVAGKSGKVTSCTRKRELLNKQLQLLADAVAHQIQFAPAKDKTYHGRIWVQFSCPIEEVEKLVKDMPRGAK